MNALRSCVALLRQFSGRYLCGLRSCDIMEEFCRGTVTESNPQCLPLMKGLQLPVFRLMCIIDLGHKIGSSRDCLGYGRCGGKPLQQQDRRASLVATVTLIILTHLLILAPTLHPQKFFADWSQSNHQCSIFPQTCPMLTSNNRLLPFSTHPHHKIMCITQFSRSWGSRISGFRTQQFRLQMRRTHNLTLTSRSCSGTETFLNSVGVWWLERPRLLFACFYLLS